MEEMCNMAGVVVVVGEKTTRTHCVCVCTTVSDTTQTQSKRAEKNKNSKSTVSRTFSSPALWRAA